MHLNEVEIQKILDAFSMGTAEEKTNVLNKIKDIDGKALKQFIMPLKNKSYWYHSALIFFFSSTQAVEDTLPDLLVWLQDMNWPGAKEIIDVLLKVERTTLLRHIENTLVRAGEQNDDMWIAGLKCLINAAGFQKEDFKNQNLYDILKRADF